MRIPDLRRRAPAQEEGLHRELASLPALSLSFGISQAWSSHHEGRLAKSQLVAAPQEVTSKMRHSETKGVQTSPTEAPPNTLNRLGAGNELKVAQGGRVSNSIGGKFGTMMAMGQILDVLRHLESSRS